MLDFLRGVYLFVSSIISNMRFVIVGNAEQNTTLYDTFMNKQIIYGDLINIGLTWRELLLYVSTWIIVILFIIFIFKLVSGVIRFFFIGR